VGSSCCPAETRAGIRGWTVVAGLERCPAGKGRLRNFTTAAPGAPAVVCRGGAGRRQQPRCAGRGGWRAGPWLGACPLGKKAAPKRCRARVHGTQLCEQLRLRSCGGLPRQPHRIPLVFAATQEVPAGAAVAGRPTPLLAPSTAPRLRATRPPGHVTAVRAHSHEPRVGGGLGAWVVGGWWVCAGTGCTQHYPQGKGPRRQHAARQCLAGRHRRCETAAGALPRQPLCARVRERVCVCVRACVCARARARARAHCFACVRACVRVVTLRLYIC
jgi:hypothetical protein